MKALSIKNEDKNKQIKITLMLVAVIIVLLSSIFVIQSKFNIFKMAKGPLCIAPAQCFFQPRPDWENINLYTIELYEDDVLVDMIQMSHQEALSKRNMEGYVVIDFPQTHQESSYKCKVKAENECGPAIGEDSDTCEACVPPEPTPSEAPTSTPPPTITVTLTPTVIPTTTPVPGCFDRRCDTNDDCIGLENHQCKDIGGDYGKRCILYPNANCNLDMSLEELKICYCTTQPTAVPTATLTPTATPVPGQPTNTPVPGQPTNTPVPGQPTVTPTPTGSVSGGDDSPTPTDIIIVKATNTPGPEVTSQQTTSQPTTTTTQLPSVGFINPTLIILFIGFVTILIPLFVK